MLIKQEPKFSKLADLGTDVVNGGFKLQYTERKPGDITNNTKYEQSVSVSGAITACRLINDGWRYLSQVAGRFVASSFW
jgi:hypothetical protein